VPDPLPYSRSFHILAALGVSAFVMGCSSAASSPTLDAGHDSATKHAVKDAGTDARTVCEPVPAVDAGQRDAEVDARSEDARSDSRAADAAPAQDAGPIPCTHDTECPVGHICDTSGDANARTCVENDGTKLCVGAPDGGGAPGTCSVNPDDMCCAATVGCIARPVSGTGGVCCPGPSGDLYCQGQLSSAQGKCGLTGTCAVCMDLCAAASPVAYQKFLGYQVAECGCQADGACYDACHTSTTLAASSACGSCLTAQTKEGLDSTCTLAAAVDCSNDPACTTYQACAGMCPM